jgi:hypothetical protein
MQKLVDGQLTDLTAEEIVARQVEEAAWEAGVVERTNAAVRKQRQAAYAAESDPLFFAYQRAECTKQMWLDKIAEIKARFPYLEE